MGKESKVLSKNLIWDKTLFKEGIRQTKWIALAALIICALFVEYSPFSYILGMIMVCIMLYRLLRFSNKRNSSDFYNGLCKSKASIYVSYLSVVLMWIILITVGFYIVSRLSIIPEFLDKTYHESYGVTDGNLKSIYESKLVEAGELFAVMLLATGAFAVSMASTGNAITHVLAMLIILLAPRFLCSYYLSGYYDLIPFITENEWITVVFNNNLNVVYDSVNNMFLLTKSCMPLFEYWWIPIIYSGLMGIGMMILGAVIFKRKKAENAGVVALNSFWKFVLRTVLALVIAIAADFSFAERIFYGAQAEADISTIVIFYIISILVWILFDLFTGKSKKKLLKSIMQLPAFIILNAIVVVSIVMCGYKVSEVPELTEIKSVEIDYANIDYNDSVSYDAKKIMDNFIEMTDESYFNNDKVTELIIERLSNDMMRFRSPSISYSLDVDSDDYMRVNIETDSDTIARYVTLDGYLLQEISKAYIEAAADIYDYNLPIKPIDPTDYDKYQLGTLNSFTWDFSADEINEIYNCFYEEAKAYKYPLKTFLDAEYNSEGTFEFFTFYDSTKDKGDVFVPIGVNSPKALEKLAQISNAKRTDFDFEWFINYVNSIGNEEKGAALDVLLYTDNDPNIRYEAFSFWSNYTADLSDENLNKLNEIIKAHEYEKDFKADENILVILYRDIENVSPTCKWFNISNAEAEIVNSMIWKEGYFNALKYSNYYY